MAPSVRSLVTDQSVRTELANSKEHLRQLTAELTLLQDRLAHQLGGDADVAPGWDVSPMLARLEQRAAELEFSPLGGDAAAFVAAAAELGFTERERSPKCHPNATTYAHAQRAAALEKAAQALSVISRLQRDLCS